VEVLSLLCAFQYFAPLREMLLLLGRFFHTFEAFPHPSADGRQSCFGMLPFGDFDATLTEEMKDDGLVPPVA
jgi:hypothetical protein